MRTTFSGLAALALVLQAALTGAAFAAPAAVINASPDNGRAPLPVFFDASLSSADAVSFLWEFGDGAVSTAKTVTHTYNVAGTYNAQLTVTDAAGVQSSAHIQVTVTGSGEGPVSADMNFRWTLSNAKIALNHATTGKDTLEIFSYFNTVDLPPSLHGVAASFSVNGLFTVSGVLNEEGTFVNADNHKPSYFVQTSVKEQTLIVSIAAADMAAALAASGAGDITASKASVPITFTLTIGAQSYSLTENFLYTSKQGGKGAAQFSLGKKIGAIENGFFVLSQATALENKDGTGHFFEFDGFLSAPKNVLLGNPVSGGFAFRFNDADKEVVLYDRLRRKGNVIYYRQPERNRGGISQLTIDTVTRRFTVKTWDIVSNVLNGGTGLPLRGDAYTAFDFVLRIDFDQPDGSVLQGVTSTRLARRSTADAFWQTGRRTK